MTLSDLLALAKRATPGPRFWSHPAPLYLNDRFIGYRLKAGQDERGLDVGHALRTEPPGAAVPCFEAAEKLEVIGSDGYGLGSEGSDVRIAEHDAAYLAALDPTTVRLLIAVAQAAENNGCCMLCGEASDPRCDEKLTASLVALHAHLEKG